MKKPEYFEKPRQLARRVTKPTSKRCERPGMPANIGSLMAIIGLLLIQIGTLLTLYPFS